MRPVTDDELEDIRTGLAASVEGLCDLLLGKPTSKSGSEWRWGRKGSFSVEIRGAKRGLWKDHEADEGGDMLGLIRRDQCGGDWQRTVEWARSFLGMGDAPSPMSHKRQARPDVAATRARRDAAAEADKADRKNFAVRLWQESQRVETTAAETYLIETRKIPRPARGWPVETIRYHPGRRALIVAATAATGEVQAVQLVHLTSGGQKRIDEDRPTKQSFGPQDGAVVRLGGSKDSLLLAEGPETGLSLWAATGRETWIALGSMGKVELPPLRQAVLCSDDDKRDSPAAKVLRKALARWRGEAREVCVATPWNPRRFDGSDFNDLIREGGPAAVRARITIALQPQGPQPPGKKAIPLPMARLELGRKVAGFFDQAQDYDPDVQDGAAPIAQGVKVGVGIGKSHSARLEAAKMLTALRARGDHRTVAMAVPTHKLGTEQAAAFEALPEAQAAGLRAAVWRGRAAADPDQSGQAMCHDLEAVEEVQGLGLRVESSVCRRTVRGGPPVQCLFYEMCGYQRQKAADADLWLVPHEILFGEKPTAIGKLAALIVDESVFRKGLDGVDGSPMELTLDALSADVTLPGEPGNSISNARLQHVHRITAAALDRLPEGPLSRQALLAAGLTNETGRDGRALSWLRVTDPGLMPGMSRESRRELLEDIGQNKAAIRLARFFGALEALLQDGGPDASGWAALAMRDTKEGPQRVIRLRGRRDVAKGWKVPTLHLDALLAPDLVRFYWPNLEVVAEIEAQTPHMTVRQLHGKDWVKSALVPDDYSTPAEGDRRLKNSKRLRAAVWREVRETKGHCLVVAQKAVREYWETCGVMPSNVAMAHHNAVAGRDEWKDTSLLVSIGRTQPKPGDVERIAEALTGAAVINKVARYERRDAAVHMADGTSMAGESDFHPDPVAEAVRWHICEGELIQIIGRVRPSSRTAATPVDVLLLTDRPIPLEIHSAVSWEELMPSPIDMMLSQGGVALHSPADASRCYPDLWPTAEAAKKAFQRGTRAGHSPLSIFSIGECPRLVGGEYQKLGERQKPVRLAFDPSAVDDLHTWLEDRLGGLARLQVDQPEPEPDPAAPPPVDPDALLSIQNRAPEVDPDSWPTAPSAGSKQGESPAAIRPGPGHPPPEQPAPPWRA